jgi:hypothetical protein
MAEDLGGTVFTTRIPRRRCLGMHAVEPVVCNPSFRSCRTALSFLAAELHEMHDWSKHSHARRDVHAAWRTQPASSCCPVEITDLILPWLKSALEVACSWSPEQRTKTEGESGSISYLYTPSGNQSSRWRPLTCAELHVGTELRPYRIRTSRQTHALIDWALPCRITGRTVLSVIPNG